MGSGLDDEEEEEDEERSEDESEERFTIKGGFAKAVDTYRDIHVGGGLAISGNRRQSSTDGLATELATTPGSDVSETTSFGRWMREDD